MASTNVEMDITDRSRSYVTWRMLLSDFANMLKAFMGANYLSIAYAFKQSGLIPGIVCLIIIAAITDHCCHLIVKCKYYAIDKIIMGEKSKYSDLGEDHNVNEDNVETLENDDMKKIRKQMVRNMTYGDVGRISFGSKGLLVVNACLLFTQFGFCVGYFIFVGNTVHSLFPVSNVTSETPDSQNRSESALSGDIVAASTGIPPVTSQSEDILNSTSIMNLTQDLVTSAMSIFDNLTTIPSLSPATSNGSHYSDVSDAIDLRILVIAPFPIFVLFAFMRDVRHLGLVSVAADIAIFVGCVVTMLYLMIGFESSSTYGLYEWSTLPVFFGMVTSAFEGIGTIIPIESSMEGNRHNFSKFLNGAVCILSFVLLVFGIMGYLRYGDDTDQMLNKNLPNGSIVGILINICLCIGVILTFPLQIYPVIELAEIYIFGDGKLCGPKRRGLKSGYDSDDDDEDDDHNDLSSGVNKPKNDRDLLLPKEETGKSTAIITTISDEVATWKRNMLRIIIVVVAGGLAIVLRNLYAYVGAFIGAIGSSLLAYILPCAFHLRLSWFKSSAGIRTKDILIIVFGVTASIISLYKTITKVVTDF